MKVLAICIGTPEPTTVKSGLTGHFKKPVKGAVAVHSLGLEGDHICDTKNHGGVDQAVYLFGTADRDYWAEVYGKPLEPGFFGENILIDGLTSADLCIGDSLTIGDTVLQVTATRIPCATYQAHIGKPDAMTEFMAAAKAGAYARVLTPGTVTAGQFMTVTPWNGTRISVASAMWHYVDGFKDLAFCNDILTVPAHHKMHETATSRLAAQ